MISSLKVASIYPERLKGVEGWPKRVLDLGQLINNVRQLLKGSPAIKLTNHFDCLVCQIPRADGSTALVQIPKTHGDPDTRFLFNPGRPGGALRQTQEETYCGSIVGYSPERDRISISVELYYPNIVSGWQLTIRNNGELIYTLVSKP